jgi:hypothetical protein
MATGHSDSQGYWHPDPAPKQPPSPTDLGQANTNDQSGDNAPGLGGVAQDLGISSSYQANAPNQPAYQGFVGNAQGYQQQYNQMAQAAQGTAAPTITNPYQQESRAGLANAQQGIGQAGTLTQNVYNDLGNLPNTAGLQLRQMQSNALANAQAVANSGRGGAIANAGAQRAAGEQAATTLAANANAQAQQWADNLRAAKLAQLGAAQQIGGLAEASGGLQLGEYNLESDLAAKQANLAQSQNQINNQYSLGLINAANEQGAQELHGIQGSTDSQLGAEKINSQTAENAAQGGQGLFQGIASTIGQGVGALAGV